MAVSAQQGSVMFYTIYMCTSVFVFSEWLDNKEGDPMFLELSWDCFEPIDDFSSVNLTWPSHVSFEILSSVKHHLLWSLEKLESETIHYIYIDWLLDMSSTIRRWSLAKSEWDICAAMKSFP